jgi:hypothetical protein
MMIFQVNGSELAQQAQQPEAWQHEQQAKDLWQRHFVFGEHGSDVDDEKRGCEQHQDHHRRAFRMDVGGNGQNNQQQQGCEQWMPPYAVVTSSKRCWCFDFQKAKLGNIHGIEVRLQAGTYASVCLFLQELACKRTGDHANHHRVEPSLLCYANEPDLFPVA